MTTNDDLFSNTCHFSCRGWWFGHRCDHRESPVERHLRWTWIECRIPTATRFVMPARRRRKSVGNCDVNGQIKLKACPFLNNSNCIESGFSFSVGPDCNWRRHCRSCDGIPFYAAIPPSDRSGTRKRIGDSDPSNGA